MATSSATTKKSTTRTSSKTSAKATKESSAEVTVAVNEEPEKIVAKEIDIHEYIPVRNGFHGVLVYKSSKTGEEFLWHEFGDTQEMELQELKNAKSSSKKFFENNWFVFDEDYAWVINYLGMGQYYAHSLGIDNFDDFFTKSATEIKKALAEMSDGQKRSIGYRAHELIAEGEIDSIKVINALEEGLGIELIER